MKKENIFDKNGKLMAQNWQRHNGDWMHKWIDFKINDFYKFSWGGKAKGKEMDSRYYKKTKI